MSSYGKKGFSIDTLGYPLTICEKLAEHIAGKIQKFLNADYDSEVEFVGIMMGVTFETQQSLIAEILKSDKISHQWDNNKRPELTEQNVIEILRLFHL